MEHGYQTAENLFSILFSATKVNSFNDAKKGDTTKFANFFLEMLRQRIFLSPSAFEAWFVNEAIPDQDDDKVLKVADISAQMC